MNALTHQLASIATLYLVLCNTVLAASAVNITQLPIGDGKLSTKPTIGYVFNCPSRFGGGGAQASGAWINGDGTFDLTKKPTVDGAMSWPNSVTFKLENDVRVITTNDLPNHPTGIFPVSKSDDAYAFDRNPNSIKPQAFELRLARVPKVADTPSCVGMGPIGFLLTGAAFFNALDARGEDAVAHEIQDACQGHPERNGTYHYHSVTSCLNLPEAPNAHSPLVGYALDGFGIYGNRGEHGKPLSNADLDECHGHSHSVNWDGKNTSIYHYHATHEYPYTLGCFKGKPIDISQQIVRVPPRQRPQ